MRLLHDPGLLSRTIGDIYDCVLEPARWEAVLADLCALIGARRAGFSVMTAAGQVKGRQYVIGISDADGALQHESVNPLAPFGFIHPIDRAFVASRDFGLSRLRATRFHREVLAPRGDADAVGFVVMREGDAFASWLLVTQVDRAPITEEEAAGFELVAPHLRRAAEISNLFGLKRLEAETCRAALDQLDAAVMILDGERRPAYVNARAEADLEAGAVFRLREGRVAGATASADAALRRIARGPLAGGAGGFEASVEDARGVERLLFAVGLDASADGLFGEAARLTMLVLRAPREATRNPVAVAARLFDLTPAQVQVLFFLAQGHAPDAIADILGVSTATVRTHLADLFRRTGTSRQAELVARALSLASPVRPPERG